MADVAAGEAAFPTGLKVMVVDDDPLCLKVIEKMLLVCKYQGSLAFGVLGVFVVASMVARSQCPDSNDLPEQHTSPGDAERPCYTL